MSEEKKGKPPVFDAERPIEIKLRSAEGTKIIALRFPTDPEWIGRQKKRKLVVKNLGRGLSETIAPDSGESDLELVATLRKDENGPSIDKYEATQIIDQLNRCDVEDVVEEAGLFRISMRVPGGLVTHVLRMPSARDIIQHRRAYCRSLDAPYNQQQITINLAAAGETYSKLDPHPEGYAGAVPIIHQAAAVNVAIAALESGIGVTEPENF